MIGDAQQHIMPSNSAEEGLIIYSISKSEFFCTLSTCTQGSQTQTLDYITFGRFPCG